MRPSFETLCRHNSAHPDPVKIPLTGYGAHRFVLSHTIVLVSYGGAGPTYDHGPEIPTTEGVSAE